VKCQCCGSLRQRLHGVNSRLIPSMQLMLCTDCKNADKEPRHIVVLAAASGVDVREIVLKRQYCGRELTAREIVH